MKFILTSLFLNFASAFVLHADFLIGPQPTGLNSYSGKQGPFLVTSDVIGDERLQQVYGARDFRSPGTAIRITDISFATGLGPINVMLPNIAIHFSTTSRDPGGLNTTFAQ